MLHFSKRAIGFRFLGSDNLMFDSNTSNSLKHNLRRNAVGVENASNSIYMIPARDNLAKNNEVS